MTTTTSVVQFVRHVAPVLLLLAATAIVLVAVVRSPLPWRLDMGTADDTRLSTHFSVAEQSGDTTFRWSDPRSRFLLHGTTGMRAILALRLFGDERTQPKDLQVTLRRADEDLATLSVQDTGWRVYHVLVPPDTTHIWSLRATPLDLTCSSYRQEPNDHRTLGIPVDSLTITPVHAPYEQTPLLPLWRAVLSIWLVALLAALLWLLDRWLLPRSPHQTGVRVSLLTAPVAIGLVIVAWRDPATFAWALPPLPWIAGLTTLVVLGGMPLSGNHLNHKGRDERKDRTGFWAIGGIALLVGAQVLFHTQVALPLALALACVGIILVARIPGNSEAPRPQGEGMGVRASLIALALIFLLALGLRFYRLDDIPYGLWRDEARHGLIAVRILEQATYRPIYVAAGGVNMPALGFYPFALALKLWGIHAWSMRPMTALAGALTVFPVYAVVSRMTGNRLMALLAAALLAVSSWHLTISRFSFPSVFEPLFAWAGFWMLLVGIGSIRGIWIHLGSSVVYPYLASGMLLLGAGVSFGVAMQNYHTGRAVPMIAGVLALLLLLPDTDKQGISRKDATSAKIGQRSDSLYKSPSASGITRDHWHGKRWLVGMVVVGIGFVLALGPLISYALSNPAAFNNRVSRVFILSEQSLQGTAPLTALDDSIGRHALMLNLRGDSNGRHHAPDAPMLDTLTGLGFLVGCAVLLRRRDRLSIFLAAGLAISILPSLLAVEGPHAMRSIGAAAFACAIAAIGWVEIVLSIVRYSLPHVIPNEAKAKRSEESRLLVRVPVPWNQSRYGHTEQETRSSIPIGIRVYAPILIVVLALVLNVWTYFVTMPTTPAVWASSYPVHTQIGSYVRRVAEREGVQAVSHLYIQSKLARNSVVEFLAHNLPFQTYEGRTLSQPASAQSRMVISGYMPPDERAALVETFGLSPEPVEYGPLLPDGKNASFVVYAFVPGTGHIHHGDTETRSTEQVLPRRHRDTEYRARAGQESGHRAGFTTN